LNAPRFCNADPGAKPLATPRNGARASKQNNSIGVLGHRPARFARTSECPTILPSASEDVDAGPGVIALTAANGAGVLGREKTSSGRISLTPRSGFPSQLGWAPAAFQRPLVAVAPPAICRGRRGGRGPLAMAVPNHVRPRHTQTGRRCALAAMHFLCAWSLRHRNTQFRGKFRCGLRQ